MRSRQLRSWPRLCRAVADQPTELALLEEIEAEHAVLDPLLSAVDEALTSRPGGAARQATAGPRGGS
jgi:hypothetical protein